MVLFSRRGLLRVHPKSILINQKDNRVCISEDN